MAQTAIKNFLSSHKRATFKLLLGLAISSLAACGGLQSRQDIEQAQAVQQKPTPTPHSISTNPIVGPPLPQVTYPTPVPEVMGPPSPPKPTVLQREAPRIGLILGPGGMKAYAHLGILKELQRAHIPVSSLVGIEWGAVIGAAYALQGQVNEAEWKSFRLRESDVPGNGFLSAKVKSETIQSLNAFLGTIFAKSALDRARIDFACPSYNIRSEKFQWNNKGSVHEALARCVPYQPYYTDNNGWMAEPFSVSEAAAYLRAKGANIIVFANVLAQGELFPSKLFGEQFSETLLWAEVRRELNRPKIPGVDWVINVNTTDHGLTDFEGRRAMMEQGARAAQDIVAKLSSQYGF